ncbi:hypothetical protein, partial [Streptomyces collinus]|uniref:hypothetical protein n=1 Tax=Streptomyces collinus TaxID=42684 RepID=UPI00367FB3F2
MTQMHERRQETVDKHQLVLRTRAHTPLARPTDLECVMSSWWLALEAGAGEAAVEDVGVVLE